MLSVTEIEAQKRSRDVEAALIHWARRPEQVRLQALSRQSSQLSFSYLKVRQSAVTMTLFLV